MKKSDQRKPIRDFIVKCVNWYLENYQSYDVQSSLLDAYYGWMNPILREVITRRKFALLFKMQLERIREKREKG